MHASLIAITLAFPGIAVALGPSTYTVVSNYGDWIVTSSESFREGEVGAILTHFNLFLNSSDEGAPLASFTGSVQGDGGKFWITTYEFSSNGPGLSARRIMRKYSPLWSLDVSGGAGLLHDQIEELKWDGKSFVHSSTSEVSGISFYGEKKRILVRIAGPTFSRTAVSLGNVDDDQCVILQEGLLDGSFYRAKLSDGREVFVKPESVFIPGYERIFSAKKGWYLRKKTPE